MNCLGRGRDALASFFCYGQGHKNSIIGLLSTGHFSKVPEAGEGDHFGTPVGSNNGLQSGQVCDEHEDTDELPRDSF